MNLLEAVQAVKNQYPERKLFIDPERLKKIYHTGSASGPEIRMIAQYLGIYLYEMEEKFGYEINYEL